MPYSKSPYSCPGCGVPYGPRPGGEKGPYPYCETCKAKSLLRIKEWNKNYNASRPSRKRPKGSLRTLTCRDCQESFQWKVTSGTGPHRCSDCMPIREDEFKEQRLAAKRGGKSHSRATQMGHNAKVATKLRHFGISVVTYRAVKACDSCGDGEPGGKGTWNLDHDHSCCKGCPSCFRGFLCHYCNTGVGLFRDEPNRLRLAADYLERHASRRAA